MFIGNLLGQWQETMFNKKQSDSVFLLFIFLGTIRWNKLLCVFLDCLQMMIHFLLGYSYKNGLHNY